MAPQGVGKSASVADRLLAEPYRFDFYQAVRLLERLAMERARQDGVSVEEEEAAEEAAEAAAGPGDGEEKAGDGGGGDDRNDQDDRPKRRPAPPFGAHAGRPLHRGSVGQDHHPRREVVRFRSHASLSFPSGSIAEMRIPPDQVGSDDPQPEMVVPFMGLIGPIGVLPRHYTSIVIERMREKDRSLYDFLDLFTHRAVSLFFRAWEKYRFPTAYERARLQGKADPELFSLCLYCLVGFGTDHLRGRMAFEDEHLLFHAGHFSHQPRAAASLELIVEDYFDVPTKVLQFWGQWIYLRPEDRSALPDRWNNPKGLNSQLGRSVVLGEKVWDVQGSFRLRLGPLTYEQFSRFLPDGRGLLALCQMVRTYVGPEFEFDVQPVLESPEVPRCRLGDRRQTARLGRNLWVKSRPAKSDFEGAVFSLKHI